MKEMKEIQITGGARVGRANATFPFATLKVNKNRLEINASIVGNLVFQRSDITSIEPYISIPFIGQGIKINHTVSSYKEKVVFWTFKDPKSIIMQIKETGFLDNDSSSNQLLDRTLTEKQAQGGFPIKKSVAIILILLWNILLLADFIPFFLGDKQGIPIGNGVLTATGLLFLTALLSLISPLFRRLILKEGREWNDIKRFAIFILIVSAILFVNFGLIFNFFK